MEQLADVNWRFVAHCPEARPARGHCHGTGKERADEKSADNALQTDAVQEIKSEHQGDKRALVEQADVENPVEALLGLQ